jgi:hypothetical protein
MQNITELRKSLAENYEQMKHGKMEIQLGQELSRTAGKIISSLKVEIQYNQMQKKKKKIAFLEG